MPSICFSVVTTPAADHAASTVPSMVGAVAVSTTSVYDSASTRVSVPSAPGVFHACEVVPSVTRTSKPTCWPSVAPVTGRCTTTSYPVAVVVTTPWTDPVPSRRKVCSTPSTTKVRPSVACTVASVTDT